MCRSAALLAIAAVYSACANGIDAPDASAEHSYISHSMLDISYRPEAVFGHRYTEVTGDGDLGSGSEAGSGALPMPPSTPPLPAAPSAPPVLPPAMPPLAPPESKASLSTGVIAGISAGGAVLLVVLALGAYKLCKNVMDSPGHAPLNTREVEITANKHGNVDII